MSSQSDEEEDFLSADEEAFDEEEGCRGAIVTPQTAKGDKEANKGNTKGNLNEVIEGQEEANKKPAAMVRPPSESDSTEDESTNEQVTFPDKDSTKAQRSETEPKCKEAILKASNNSNEDNDDDDDDEALAERIRERNLKIARKFSAEIARNLKVSAPIPVKTSSLACDIEQNEDTPRCKASMLPPAPPSTPALSSSYTNLNDQNTAGTSPPLNTQYGWRIPSKSITQQSSGASTPSRSVKAEDQARQALDKLSEKLSQTDKYVFERVVADIKKVSIKDEEVPTTSDLASALPSITDLGSTLGGWGWSGATKLLSSASQVTSQVGSVLDSVVGAAASNSSRSATDGTGENNASANQTDGTKQTNDNKPRQASQDITYNDPLVDFTLNAMESLGKKAFGVMTTRNESGSLEIKGLGRPWEHLLNAKRTNDSSKLDESSEVQPMQRPSSPSTDDMDPISVVHEASSSDHKTKSDEPLFPSTLKLRKRRHDYD